MKTCAIEKWFFILAIFFLIMLCYMYNTSGNVQTHFDGYTQEDMTEMLYEVAKQKKILHTIEQIENNITDIKNDIADIKQTEIEKDDNNLKYILQWTSSKDVPFVYMGKGQAEFIRRNCTYTNCFVTDDRKYLGDHTKFDVIAFAGPQVTRWPSALLPSRRSERQKFVFASIESSHYYPACTNIFNNFFNWTWTFRLDSESKWGYIVVRDINGTIIGPKKDMKWMNVKAMSPVKEDLKTILKQKTKAAAWFVSNCKSKSKREDFTKSLQKELNKFNLVIDIYGRCGKKQCSRDNETKCDLLIQKDYYFYLSFENSFSEDYVTEKLLHALEYNAIPVVFGGANYTRFMPDGIYLNAVELGAVKLAAKMNELIKDPEKYAEYFKWMNHYKYHRRAATPETDDYCGMCRILNDKDKMNEVSIYQDFRRWWNGQFDDC